MTKPRSLMITKQNSRTDVIFYNPNRGNKFKCFVPGTMSLERTERLIQGWIDYGEARTDIDLFPDRIHIYVFDIP